MTPYERLLAEAIPTGTFGDAQPPTSQPARQTSAWTPAQQLAHRQELEAALEGWSMDDNPRHLRAVPHAA
ncbi:hypothetical protein [Streptomyces sp. NPDC096153]|uniref:hypothetical protein n=1 Tax=Streptomyces sp. NPDC096153 TaxID=3155548 RepID=UPI00332F3624